MEDLQKYFACSIKVAENALSLLTKVLKHEQCLEKTHLPKYLLSKTTKSCDEAVNRAEGQGRQSRTLESRIYFMQDTLHYVNQVTSFDVSGRLKAVFNDGAMVLAVKRP